MSATQFPTTHDLSAESRQRRGRIWVDGCFDFAHHGHAGAMLQARQLGTELYVGVHSDEEITVNKGPPVMDLAERIVAVDACRWVTRGIPDAPYVTQLYFIDRYNSQYVVHGDDITADVDGNDCYRFVKESGRFLVVRRTPGISTTDLVGRMLAGLAAGAAAASSTAQRHHVRSLQAVLAGEEACASGSGPELQERITKYATDASGLLPCVSVWHWEGSPIMRDSSKPSTDFKPWTSIVVGKGPLPGQRIVYVDGGWDLFCSGHIAFLQAVIEAEQRDAIKRSWFSDEARQQRILSAGSDYAPMYLVAGVHTDEEVNTAKKSNYPIMSIFERGLCVLQCRYISALLFSAPRTLTHAFLGSFPFDNTRAPYPDAVYHGPLPSSDIPEQYQAAEELGLFSTISEHPYQEVHAETIVGRILNSRSLYEERQRIKGVKAVGEEEIRGKAPSG